VVREYCLASAGSSSNPHPTTTPPKKSKEIQKQNEQGMVVHIYNLSTWESETRELRVQGLLGKHNEF
jgi:hypothetical protein